MDIQMLQITQNQLNRLSVDASLFKVGKILSGMIGQNTQGYTLLLAKGAEIPIKTQLPLTKGEVLNFRVAEASGDTIVLKLQAPPQKMSSQGATPEQVLVQNALKQAIPKQGSYSPLLSNLNQIRAQNPEQLQQNLKQASTKLIESLPTLKQTTDPEGLKQAIKNSGIFLEAKLASAAKGNANSSAQLQGDLKANLLKLYSALSKQLARDQGAAAQKQVPTEGKQAAQQNPIYTIQHHSGHKALHTQQQIQQLIQQHAQQPNVGKPATPTQAQVPTQPPLPQTQPQQQATPNNPYANAAYLDGSQHKGQIPFPAKGQFPRPQAAQGPNIDLLNTEATQQKITSQVEASLSRMQLNQIASLPVGNQEGVNMTWLLDVPIRSESRTDIMQMAIEERDAHDPDAPEDMKQWHINLAIDLEHTGPMQASIRLYGKKIQVDVWSEDPDAHFLVKSELRDLRQELEKHEFEVDELNAHVGLNETINVKNTLNLVDAKI